MTDLNTRFRTLDDLPAPDLWPEVEAKASAAQREGVRTLPWVLIAVTLLLALAVGGAVLIGSGVVKMPVVEIPAPAETSAAPSSTPGQNSAPTWTATGKMIQVRTGCTATLLPDGKVLVAGGSVYRGDDLIYLSSAELYDPGNGTWTATGNMIEARQGHTATLLPDGKVLVSGGYSGGSDDHFLSSAELYDPGSGTWTATGNMIEARYDPTATVLPDGKVLVAGGDGGSNSIAHALSSAELYDPESGTWTATRSMVKARYLQTATPLLDGKVLVAGGDSSGLPSAELYDPGSGIWTATGAMTVARNSHTATLLPDGKVLVAGGDSASPSAELFDTGSGIWTATRTMVGVRHFPTATLLPDGKVLVAGGSVFRGGDLDYLSSAELYDPRSGTWTATGAMIWARNAATATLLPDGRVLVVGGSVRPPELYDPGGGS